LPLVGYLVTMLSSVLVGCGRPDFVWISGIDFEPGNAFDYVAVSGNLAELNGTVDRNTRLTTLDFSGL
jgi:hypothetical protein